MAQHTSVMIGRRAFTLIELLLTISIIVILIGILLPTLREARSSGRRAVCISNLRQQGIAHHGYINDFKGSFAVFTGPAETRMESAAECAIQAARIVSEHTGETMPTQRLAGGTTPQHWFMNVMLTDYFGGKLRSAVNLCPSDSARQDWSKRNGRAEMLASPFQPKKQINRDNIEWWPYSSSYQLMPAAWGHERGIRFNCEQEAVMHQLGTHDTYWDNYCGPELSVWGRRRIEDVAVPSNKVAMADEQSRHFGKTIYFAYSQAKQPLLFWDGSVSTRRTGDANPGWDPTDPRNSAAVKYFAYYPDLGFESPTPNNAPLDTVFGWYKWTRGGLQGVDYNGREYDTSSWED